MTTSTSPVLQAIANNATVLVLHSIYDGDSLYTIQIYLGDVRRKDCEIPPHAHLLTLSRNGGELEAMVGQQIAALVRGACDGGQQTIALTRDQVLKLSGELVGELESAQRDWAPDLFKLLDQKQLFEDMMETRREMKQPIPQAWVDKLAAIRAQLRGADHEPEALYSNVVEGHPLFDGAPILRNLIPIKVDNTAEAERKLFAAQDLYARMAGERARAEHAVMTAKTGSAKRNAADALRDLDSEGVTADAVATFRMVTLVELQRLAREAETRFGPAVDKAPTPAARKSSGMSM